MDTSVIPPSVCPLLSQEGVRHYKRAQQLQGDITECSTCGIGIEINGKLNIENEHNKKITCSCRSLKVALQAEGWWKMAGCWQCPACQYHEDKEKFNSASPSFIGVRDYFVDTVFKRDESPTKEFIVCYSHRVRAGKFLGCDAYGPATPPAVTVPAAAANDNRKTAPAPPPPPPPPAKYAAPVTASKAAAPSPPVHQIISLQDELQRDKINEMDAKVQSYFWAELYYTSCHCATRIQCSKSHLDWLQACRNEIM